MEAKETATLMDRLGEDLGGRVLKGLGVANEVSDALGLSRKHAEGDPPGDDPKTIKPAEGDPPKEPPPATTTTDMAAVEAIAASAMAAITKGLPDVVKAAVQSEVKDNLMPVFEAIADSLAELRPIAEGLKASNDNTLADMIRGKGRAPMPASTDGGTVVSKDAVTNLGEPGDGADGAAKAPNAMPVAQAWEAAVRGPKAPEPVTV